MRDAAGFRQQMLKPFLAMIGLTVLLGACGIGVAFWRLTHDGHPRWAANIALWEVIANAILLAGWFTFVIVRRTRWDTVTPTASNPHLPSAR